MVPEQPPRRSKAEKEPITIDLPVEPGDTLAEPVRSNDGDDPVSAAPTDDAVAAEPAPVQYDITDEPVMAPSADEPLPADELLAVDEPPVADEPLKADEPAMDEPLPEPAFRSGPRSDEPDARPAPAVVQRQGPSTSALFAAGIVGGLVALTLAGSMQYAGYLPAASPAPAPDNSAVAPEISRLQEQVQALQNRPVPTDSSLAERVQALEAGLSERSQSDLPQRLAALEGQIKDVSSATRATAGNDADLARRLQEAEAKINDEGPEQQVARAVAAAALKAAIDRGGRFETELQTFAGVAGDDPAVAELQKFGSVGVPSRAQLQADFPRIADAMLDALAQPDENQGLASRLMSSAMSVVKVRRVGDVQGDTPEAVVARMEDGLRSGDLPAAARQWDSLPESAKNASQDFKQKLDARIQVENLVGSTLTRAVAGTQG
ncbi:hypothetical protein E2F50_16730 [Rhizobium deserti]|uniref:YbgF trimerisation domain-containing protein n=1 Tax=Rhizobium deserti TaxID=2547961 RepID=A0A4R5UG41_9HYPH|nr:mitofilin family membrane protein [Rhizobium deserti]TDK34482.1 hypothetical protein E2F50_16730 [Rhizobium deserti]